MEFHQEIRVVGSVPGDEMPRRGFLCLLAVAVGGPRVARAQSAPSSVLIVEFSGMGERRQAVRVPKVVKSESEWRQQLSPTAFQITRRAGTERPFTGAYWNLHDKGLFRCICCETALFSSANKFDSGTGWPSFWEVLAKENIVAHPSKSREYMASEVTCRRCDAHLGDVFDDGPRPTGLRYCIDSVALRFVKFAES